MTVTISRLYDNYADAQRAVQGLESAGVPHSDISIVANNSDNWYSGGKKVDRDHDGVDDRADNPDSEMDTDLRQQPVADEGTDDTDYKVTNEAKTRAWTILPASHPATRPTSNMTKRLSFDMCMTVPSERPV